MHDVAGGDLAADPQHGGGDVADRGPGAAGVGGDDDDAGKEKPLFLVLENPFHQGHHDDGGGHVVKNRGEEKGDESQ